MESQTVNIWYNEDFFSLSYFIFETYLHKGVHNQFPVIQMHNDAVIIRVLVEF